MENRGGGLGASPKDAGASDPAIAGACEQRYFTGHEDVETDVSRLLELIEQHGDG